MKLYKEYTKFIFDIMIPLWYQIIKYDLGRKMGKIIKMGISEKIKVTNKKNWVKQHFSMI